MADKWRQGYFTPKNPDKYIGDVNSIFLRSSWEFSFARFVDGNPNVLKWSSEEIAIEYFNPVKKRPAQYYPDFYVKYQNKRGEIHEEIIEVKPYDQVQRPTKGNKYENAQWAVNMSKWEQAIKYCKMRKIKFRVLTERSLYF